MKTLSLDEINDLDLHDHPCERIDIDFGSKKIRMIYANYDETNKDYIYHELVFNGVAMLRISDIEVDDFNYSPDIFEQDAIAFDHETFEIKLIMGVWQPITEIEFRFKQCQLNETPLYPTP